MAVSRVAAAVLTNRSATNVLDPVLSGFVASLVGFAFCVVPCQGVAMAETCRFGMGILRETESFGRR